MHNQESALENEMHKIFLDFEIKMNHLISARRPSIVIVNKKENMPNSALCYFGWPQGKTEWRGKEWKMFENWKHNGT